MKTVGDKPSDNNDHSPYLIDRSLIRKFDFGNEAGDDPPFSNLLASFVAQESFVKFTSHKHPFLVAIAKKGVGKSALAKWTAHQVKEDVGALVISCKGNDLVRSSFKLNNALVTPNDHIRDWKVRLCTLVNRHLGNSEGWAWTDDKMMLVEAAEIDGFKERNLVSALWERAKGLLPKKPETSKLAPGDPVELTKRVSDRQTWIVIDDLDATYQRTNSENLDLCSFFSACRDLVSDIPDLFIRVTLRTDVWPLLRVYDESLDKVEQYVMQISWSQKDFRKLLSSRVKANLESQNIKIPTPPARISEEEHEEFLINQVFDKKMSWGNDEQRTYKVIYTLSYHRPRWAIQLAKLAQAMAIQDGVPTISKHHIDLVWGPYGNKRIYDLVSEHKHQCSDIHELLNSFRGAPRRFSREELLAWIKNRITNLITPVIEGKPCKSELAVAHFMYRIGFLVARTSDDRTDFEHYHFDEMPDFLTSRTTVDFKVLWEIHPCYREALDIQKLNTLKRRSRLRDK